MIPCVPRPSGDVGGVNVCMWGVGACGGWGHVGGGGMWGVGACGGWGHVGGGGMWGVGACGGWGHVFGGGMYVHVWGWGQHLTQVARVSQIALSIRHHLQRCIVYF